MKKYYTLKKDLTHTLIGNTCGKCHKPKNIIDVIGDENIGGESIALKKPRGVKNRQLLRFKKVKGDSAKSFKAGYVDSYDCFVIAVLVATVVFIVWYISYTGAWREKADRFYNQCQDDYGGIVLDSGATRKDCFVDGEKIIMKGWENE